MVGTTGTGKSSLLNAMIDEYNVLPTSGTQACTAVVVKIQNNYKNDLYEADIEFLSTEVICIKQFKKGKWLNSIYCCEFAVTRNHVCLLFQILREFSRVLCKQNHLTTGWQLSWIFEVCLFGTNNNVDQPSGESFLIAVQEQTLILSNINK